MQEKGYIPKEETKKLFALFGTSKDGPGHFCFVISRIACEGSEPGAQAKVDDSKSSPDRCKEILLKVLSDEREKLEKQLEFIEIIESLKINSRMASLALPSSDSIDKILRCETTIERQLYRAINQLERLQRQRKGDSVPPPVNIEVNRGN